MVTAPPGLCCQDALAVSPRHARTQGITDAAEGSPSLTVAVTARRPQSGTLPCASRKQFFLIVVNYSSNLWGRKTFWCSRFPFASPAPPARSIPPDPAARPCRGWRSWARGPSPASPRPGRGRRASPWQREEQSRPRLTQCKRVDAFPGFHGALGVVGTLRTTSGAVATVVPASLSVGRGSHVPGPRGGRERGSPAGKTPGSLPWGTWSCPHPAQAGVEPSTHPGPAGTPTAA